MPTSRFAQALKDRLFAAELHPYRHFEREIERHLTNGGALLDAGCGRSLELYNRFRDRASLIVGMDLYCPAPSQGNTRKFVCGDVSRLAFKAESFDVVISRSVVEHLEDPAGFYSEVNRVLRPGGFCIFLTPNLWDYSALVSKMIPNRWHPWIVARTEGRPDEDTFPAYYRSNTAGRIVRLAQSAGLHVKAHRYLGQYPCYLMFNGPLFLAGSIYEKIISRFHALRFLRGWLLVVLAKPERAAGSKAVAESSRLKEKVSHA